LNLFFDEYIKFIARIEKQYHAPDSKAFRERRFMKINWTKKEYKNFFTIIKVLAERGASTIIEIIENDGGSKHLNSEKSKYNSYRRAIVGDKIGNVTGMIEKGVVVSAEAENKLDKKYELSRCGVFYAIKIFMNMDIINSGNSDNRLKMDSKIGWYDYSTQMDFPGTIIDILARNYSHVMPHLIFGKWDYLRKNPRIDVYRLYDLSTVKRGTNILINDLITKNTKHSNVFNTYDGDIALQFYIRLIENVYYPLEYFLKAIDDKEIRDFIGKIFYSYERMYRETYHKSQIHFCLFKGQRGKAMKHYRQLINSYDLINKIQKEELLKTSSEELSHSGIDFCR